MTELTDFTDPTPDLTDHERRLLRWAGADERLIEVCEFNIENMERGRDDGKAVTRNSALVEVKKYVRGTDYVDPALTEENAEEFTPYGGHFFTALWDGHLYQAWSRADYNNQAVLLEVFGEYRINATRPEHAPEVRV
ncbi:hypothetical protein M1M41_gp031 [Halorubrum sodomense tailed virus 4]|uniref:Uncharacterized protein n=1 Tax=Halorubrum sodomense tailed virus 4 TaxID=2878013 RepID=A0AAE8XU74_9CAUD|nr:hypothetical protein M1M41_gp031 [Halorubrum sodomense tailed virus 4]UBF20300.1 hypothetical protein HSTV-4_gp93 [Halorubrum sodomense tailed virus 4]UBF21989.1 hypothetical protein HJTV-3_gp100 [Haloarcula virus HJTV-3]UBF22118.1 hypothetical protein HRTV-15_gp99 [Halorubrum virus HRTV-15]